MSSEKRDGENTVNHVHSSQFPIRMLNVFHGAISRRVLKKNKENTVNHVHSSHVPIRMLNSLSPSYKQTSSEKRDKENTVSHVHSSQFPVRMLKVSH